MLCTRAYVLESQPSNAHGLLSHCHEGMLFIFIHVHCPFLPFALEQLVGTKFLPAQDLAAFAKLSTPTSIFLAENLVLEILDWDLLLVTPAHYLVSENVFLPHEDTLDTLCKRMPLGSASYLRPSVVAAALTNDSTLLKLCASADIDAAMLQLKSQPCPDTQDLIDTI